MRRAFPWFAGFAILVLVMSFPGDRSRAQDGGTLKGTYAFTLAEACVHQRTFILPAGNNGFNSSFQITDPAGAMTYGGASDGLLAFDGNGGVELLQGRATNIMNSVPDFLQTGDVPLGFGFGPAIPFACTGNYTVSATGAIVVNLTCNATVPPNPNVVGFASTFKMEGRIPKGHKDHLVLTDIGDAVQPVTIFLVGGGTVMQHRVCTRSTTLVLAPGSQDDN